MERLAILLFGCAFGYVLGGFVDEYCSEKGSA